MPIVNGKEYAYTAEGIAAAEKAKKKSGFKVKGFSGFGNTPLKSGLGLKHKSDSTGFDMDKHIDEQPVDPDAPGTPGEPGYEPPVRRSDFDEGSEQQKMFDRNQYEPPVKPADKIPMEQWYKEEEEETKKINK